MLLRRWWGLATIVSFFVACSEDESSVPTGALGESCVARRDCNAGLACIGNVCVDGKDPTSGLGSLGESCRAKNDCAPGLACIANVCQKGSISLTPSDKHCEKIECATKDDCCEDFVPSPGCDKYKQDCDADPTYCATYRTFCECNRGCENALCVNTPPGCKDSKECTSFATPFCVAGTCRECAQHGDCTGEKDRCIAGVCKPPCSVNENCPLLSECRDGECVEVGCKSDKECVFLLKQDGASCSDGVCRAPCTFDAECDTFEACRDGACVFVGCDTDAECRAFFDMENEPAGVRAVCQ